MIVEQFREFARYNRWANRLLYDAAGRLSEEDYNRDCGVFFRDMNGTLNHLVVADLVWMSRFTGEGYVPKALDERVHEDFAALRTEREALDERIVAFAEGLDDTAVAGTFTYTPVTDPTPVTQKLGPAISHVFNHQTHHRGQAHAILTRLTGEAPSIDLIYFQRHERLGTA